MDQPEGSGSGSKLSGGVIASLGGVALLVIFMLQNREQVSLDFLFWGFDWPLWLVILLSAFLGGVAWIGFGVVRRHRRRKERRS